MFRLGWFLGNGFGMQPWYGDWAGRSMTDWTQPGLYVDLTTSLERAGFDLLFIEDTSMVEDTYGSSMETTLKYGLMAPKNDPVPLVPLLTSASEHIGVVATMSTIQYPPFLAARSMATLDHLTRGRVGVNVVTSVTHRVAQNFGYDKHFDHSERYAMAEEWMELVSQLWESWEPDALVHDQATPQYADHTKVHTVDFEGKYFRCRGPLNTIPGPQRRPVVAQAGNSTPGRELAAKHADTMLALAKSPDQMKALRQDMDERLVAHGRKPQDLKILFMAVPYLADTQSEAQARFDRFDASKRDPNNIEKRLWYLSYVSGGVVDYSKYDLDGPVPQEVGNGETTTAKAWLEGSSDITLRDLAEGPSNYGMDFVGTADSVASQMQDAMEEAGGDGFLMYPDVTRRSIAEVCDGLAPELRRRGLIRDGYAHKTFRENLMDF